jgi:hypothetical protein
MGFCYSTISPLALVPHFGVELEPEWVPVQVKTQAQGQQAR